MRTKLGLSDRELMKSSWISLCLQSADFPYYDPKGKKYIRGKAALDVLNKYVTKP